MNKRYGSIQMKRLYEITGISDLQMTMPSLTGVGPEIHVQDKTVYNRLDDWISISAFLDWNKPNVMKTQE